MEKDPIKVYGARWCGDCYRAKRILDNCQIAHQWIDIDQDADAKEIVRKANSGKIVVPTIIFKDGTTLSEPSNRELRDKLEQEIKSQDA